VVILQEFQSPVGICKDKDCNQSMKLAAKWESSVKITIAISQWSIQQSESDKYLTLCHTIFFFFLYFVTFSSQVSLWNSGYSPRGEHGSDGVAPTQDIGGIRPFWWWRKPECPEETTGMWSAPKIPFIRCNTSSAASWDRTHTPHRHWLQACESDTSEALWTARPPRTKHAINPNFFAFPYTFVMLTITHTVIHTVDNCIGAIVLMY
jgi:hypothetical protein